ncbi:unnamed protein product [Rotaria sp. Silwood2]|nr:unnamed protein product [Rotaria sp. Silwood2]
MIFGTCPHLSIGTFAIISLLTIKAIDGVTLTSSTLITNDTIIESNISYISDISNDALMHEKLGIATTLAFLVGLIQELLAYGLGNIFSSFFQCFPSSGSLSRSMVQGESGGKTALIGGFSSVILAVVILALAPLLESLPMPCLAGIIIVNLKGLLFKVTDFAYYYRISMMEATTAHDLEATFNHITTQTNYMKKHIVEMDESRAMMETLTVKIRGEIQTAEADLAHENYNFGLVQAGEQEVVRVLQQCLQRQSTTDSLNKQLFQERSNYLSDKKICIEKALLLNTQLASTYRKTLYTYYEIKTRLMGKLEQRLDAVARVKDTRQLIELQARLHDALNFYFGIKNEYVEQRLDHLNRESHQNGLQLSQVQETIQSAVDHITKFLVDQVDFEAVHRDAMLKVHREELQEQQKVPV